MKNFKKKGFTTAQIVGALLGVLGLCFSCSSEESLEEEFSSVNVSAQLNSVIQAEDFDNQDGVQVVNNSRVGFIQDGDWIRFDDFDYDGANSITVRAGTTTGGGTIEVRTGSPTGGDLLGTVEVSNTGGFGNFQEFTANIDDDSSNSDLYLTFTGGSGFLFDVDSFTLNSSSSSGGSGNTPSSSNLAENGNATQSSTGFGGSASRAIDGDTNGAFRGSSVTHTSSNDNDPWWLVNLGSNTNIGQVVVWNRTDNCCTFRLGDFTVRVINSGGNTVFTRRITSAPSPSVTVNTGGVVGNRVRIEQNLNNTPLSLAEVQVFSDGGSTSTPTPTPPTGGSGDFGLNPNLEPWENFDLSDWSLDSPAPRPSDECRATRIDEDEYDEIPGSPTRPYLFTHTDGGMRFVSPVGGATTNRSCNSGFPRSELREMLRAGNTSISTTGANGNNWALGYQDPNPDHGGRNGVLSATLRINRVTTTGSGLHPGRTIIGQIHASDDEPARLYYRKCPDAEFGSIYLEHEVRDDGNEDGGDVTFNLIGSEQCNGNGPSNGFRLGELLSYEIINRGSDITVNIIRGDRDGEVVATVTVDMETVRRGDIVGSGYDRPELDDGDEVGDEWMYFKAGAYTQNNTGDDDDTDVITFYRLSNTHDSN